MAWRWPGKKGGGWVALQVLLLPEIFLGPPQIARGFLDLWPAWLRTLSFILSFACMLWGLVFGLAGLLGLGRSLSIFPRPKDDAVLATRGVYALVRHPIYSGVIASAFAWGFWLQGPLTLLGCVALVGLFNGKAVLEERWLLERFPEYSDYRNRTKRLIPWVY